MFIELTSIFGHKRLLINIKSILYTEETKHGTRIQYENGDEEVTESYDQVKELIKNEVAAERGYWYE